MSRWTNLPFAVRVAAVAWPVQLTATGGLVSAGVPGAVAIAAGTAVAAVAAHPMTAAEHAGQVEGER